MYMYLSLQASFVLVKIRVSNRIRPYSHYLYVWQLRHQPDGLLSRYTLML